MENDPVQMQPIPLVPSQSGGDPLAGAQRIAHNMVVDSAGAIHRRPGLELHPDLVQTTVDTAIDGLHVTAGGVVVAVGPPVSALRPIYQVTDVATDLSGGRFGAYLAGEGRPVIAETEQILAMAAGGAPEKLVLATMIPTLLAGSPPDATHVAANASRLLLNNLSLPGQVDYSATGVAYTEHEKWSGTGNSGSFTAESRPDSVVAIAERTGEVFVFGATTLQLFTVDPNTAYAAVITHEYGCSAPHSVARLDAQFAWIDHRRRVVISDGRGVEEIGVPVRELLDEMSTVSDAYGYRVNIGSVDALVWVFPTEQRALCYQKGAGWSQWSTGTSFGRHIANAVALKGQETLVGTTGGYIARYARGVSTDLGDPFVAFVETGALNRGTPKRKRCKRVSLVLRRGEGSGTGAVYLSWRDDEGPWSPPRAFAVGPSGDRNPVVDLYSLGVYRTRRWRMEFSGDAELVLASAIEHFEVLSM